MGGGTTRPLEGPAAAWVRALREVGLPVLALDLPSGLDPGSADVPGEAVRATRTACFGALKRCHGLLPAKQHCGEVVVVPIPLDRSPDATMRLLPRP